MESQTTTAGKPAQKAVLLEAKKNVAKKIPGLTWDRFASLADIEPRALKSYRMPVESKDYRVMPKWVYAAIEALVARVPIAPI